MYNVAYLTKLITKKTGAHSPQGFLSYPLIPSDVYYLSEFIHTYSFEKGGVPDRSKDRKIWI